MVTFLTTMARDLYASTSGTDGTRIFYRSWTPSFSTPQKLNKNPGTMQSVISKLTETGQAFREVVIRIPFLRSLTLCIPFSRSFYAVKYISLVTAKRPRLRQLRNLGLQFQMHRYKLGGVDINIRKQIERGGKDGYIESRFLQSYLIFVFPLF